MIRNCTLFIVFVLGPALALPQTSVGQDGFIERFRDDIAADFRFHYSREPLTRMAIGFAVGGVLANTGADEEIQQMFRNDLKGDLGDDLANFFTDVGGAAKPIYSFPVYLTAMWLGRGNGNSDTAVARWGANSLRAAIVAMPQVVVLSHVTGGNKPEAGEPGWDPFENDHGVSGHSYFGAVPVITAARLADNSWARFALYATSTLPGLARIYEDKHYFSQSLLGWWLAYLATETVEHTNREQVLETRVMPIAYADGGGVQITFGF